MIEFDSYLISEERLRLLSFNSREFNDLFISIRKKNKDICEILEKDYINGYISLKHNGKEMLGSKYWDDINCLWMYLINALEDIFVNNLDCSEFLFPDQPITVKIYNKGVYVTLYIDNIEYKIYKNEFVDAIFMGAQEFFQIYMDLTKKSEYKCQLEKISKLYSIIRNDF